MLLHDTTQAEYLAMAYEDSIEHQCAVHEAQQAKAARKAALAEAFVHAAAQGENAKLQAPGVNVKMHEAVYEVGTEQPELLESFLWFAAQHKSHPVLAKMVRAMADAFAEIRTRAAQ